MIGRALRPLHFLLLGAATTVSGAQESHAVDATLSATHATPGDSVTIATRDYLATGAARTIVAGDVLTFPFGHAQPTLTCTVLRACVVELQSGEIVLSRIAGDTERWEIVPAPAGADGRTTLIVVKPRDCDITTNLVIATDRRIYDLTLDAPPCSTKRVVGKSGSADGALNPQQQYARHVRFYYPDETVAAWSAPKPPAPPTIGPDVLSLNFRYRVHKDRQFPWTPTQIFDDGTRVYIKLPDAARQSEAPVLFALGTDGARTLLNYSIVGGDTYVTDRLADRLAFVAGVDGHERQAVIERDGGR